ncbi:LysR family transcriptional regulator substrate-binding protein [Leifsonia sp. RAF41]|uniref:LysR family transcriptional regulator substrate-binding protein n=1 Tax=Leifsonia sp. RAF41 TaxID=3233056 RepID=UPI003F9E59DD
MSSRFAIAFPLGVTVGKWTRAFEQRFPDVELVVRPSDDPLGVLAAGGADMVFARDAEPDDDRHLIPLYAEDIVAVVHHEHLLTLTEDDEERRLRLADLDGEPRVTGEPSEAFMRSVAEGAGIALLPASVAKALRRKDVVALRVEDAPQSRIGLTWPREGQHPLVDDFVGIVRGRTAHSSRNPEVAAKEAAAKESADARKPAAPRKAATPRKPNPRNPAARKRPRRR